MDTLPLVAVISAIVLVVTLFLIVKPLRDSKASRVIGGVLLGMLTFLAAYLGLKGKREEKAQETPPSPPIPVPIAKPPNRSKAIIEELIREQDNSRSCDDLDSCVDEYEARTRRELTRENREKSNANKSIF